MPTLFDMVLLLVLAKEALALAAAIPFGLSVALLVAFPFALGMAHPLREDVSCVVRSHVRVFLGQALTVASLLVFLGVIVPRDLVASFIGVFIFTALPYILGRFLGMSVKGLLGAAVLLVVVVAVVHAVGGTS